MTTSVLCAYGRTQGGVKDLLLARAGTTIGMAQCSLTPHSVRLYNVFF